MSGYGEEAEIMGFTAFDPAVLDLSDQCGYPVTVAVDANTIVLNESIKDSCFGRYRFTSAHEVAHLILDMVYHLNYKVRYRSNPRVIRNMNNNSFDYEEYIANRLASYLLVPEKALRIMFRKYFDCSRVDIIPIPLSMTLKSKTLLSRLLSLTVTSKKQTEARS